MKTLLKYLIIFLLLVGCKKSKFLDQIPDQSLIIPSTLEDFQALLDNKEEMNGSDGPHTGVIPGLGEVSADNYFASKSLLPIMPAVTVDTYIWSDSIYSSAGLGLFGDWIYPYQAIYYANIVLDGLKDLNIKSDQQPAYDFAKGSALFFRAHMLYQLAQVFAPHYNSETAESDLGIPLRIASDVNEKISRSTVEGVYSQIMADLDEARYLLPVNVPFKTRPSLPALYALLSRIYLTTGKYEDALKYADSCLQLESALINYNDLTSTSSWTTRSLNEEILFSSILVPSRDLIAYYMARVDSTLYKLYEPNDLRKRLFFADASAFGDDNTFYFQGSYTGGSNPSFLFGGLATDEVYLIKAECLARKGNVEDAMSTLNILLRNRYESSSFTDLTADDADEALKIILQQRRKELIFRGLRWTDLRRLNAEGANIVIAREDLAGNLFTLQPNSPRYTFLIPPEVMAFHPDWKQNPR